MSPGRPLFAGGRDTRIGLCTDSSSQIPPSLARRYGVEVVPLTVTVDEREYLEGVDLDADAFYALFADGHRPTVSSSQPSPGQFAVAYDELADRGCSEILSIHNSSSVSGTINSARLAAHGASVPIRLVDSGTANFGISCCVWAAGEALARGATLDEAASCAESIAPSIGNVFVVGALDLVCAGGRAACDPDGGGVPVLTRRDGNLDAIGRATTVDAAVETMVAYAASWGDRLRVAIGIADREVRPLALALEQALCATPNVVEAIHYRVGPSVGADTGPGTAGCFMFPVD
jgi:fatty acid-binding protein DegV